MSLIGQGFINSGGGFIPTNVKIERLLDGQSTATSQDPSGLGQANSSQIEFGIAKNTVFLAMAWSPTAYHLICWCLVAAIVT